MQQPTRWDQISTIAENQNHSRELFIELRLSIYEDVRFKKRVF